MCGGWKTCAARAHATVSIGGGGGLGRKGVGAAIRPAGRAACIPATSSPLTSVAALVAVLVAVPASTSTSASPSSSPALL